LQQFFAELDRDTTETWQKLSQRKKLCENNMTDSTQADKLYGFVAELRGADRTFAEQYVGLMESKNPLAEHATKELVKLLVPDAAEWKSRGKSAFWMSSEETRLRAKDQRHRSSVTLRWKAAAEPSGSCECESQHEAHMRRIDVVNMMHG
jgi:hypothetical protein